MKPIITAALTVLLAAGAHAAPLPGDGAEGKRLVEDKCTGCHGSGVYSPAHGTVHSIDELKAQLGQCEHAAKATLSDADKQNIIKYLNDQFYHFD